MEGEFNCYPITPKSYCINSLDYKCSICNEESTILVPHGNEIIKCKEVNGDETRWLPTYGNGGFLELLEILVPDNIQTNEVSIKIAREFERSLQPHMEKSTKGNLFTLVGLGRHKCFNCDSTELKLMKETMQVSPEVQWMGISCELIKL